MSARLTSCIRGRAGNIGRSVLPTCGLQIPSMHGVDSGRVASAGSEKSGALALARYEDAVRLWSGRGVGL